MQFNRVLVPPMKLCERHVEEHVNRRMQDVSDEGNALTANQKFSSAMAAWMAIKSPIFRSR